MMDKSTLIKQTKNLNKPKDKMIGKIVVVSCLSKSHKMFRLSVIILIRYLYLYVNIVIFAAAKTYNHFSL